jgi:hypothetical protein
MISMIYASAMKKAVVLAIACFLSGCPCWAKDPFSVRHPRIYAAGKITAILLEKGSQCAILWFCGRRRGF